jgi:superfamily II DNA helicase RecQ
MEQLKTMFEYLPEQRIGICRAHHHGVLLSQLPSHLQRSHQELTVATRQAIVVAAAEHRQWATSADAVIFPPPEAQPVAHLPVYKDGRKCSVEMAGRGCCGHIVRTLRDMQEHCRREHAWTNPRKRGRPCQGEEVSSQPWREGVWCQRFQQGRELARLFEVSPPAEVGAQYAAGDEGHMQRALEASFADGTTALQKAQQDAHAQVGADSNRYIWHEWLRRARWARHLANFNRSWLLRQARQPGEDERTLRRVCWALERVIWKAQRASSPEVVGLPAVTFIERREVGAPSNEKPFNALQTGKTMKKYSWYWVSMVSYIWRTYHLPPVEDPADNASDSGLEGETEALHAGDRRPPYRLNAGQTRALYQIQQTLLAALRDGHESHDGSGDESSGDESSSLDEEREEELERHVLAFLIALLDHQLGDHYYKSALVSATAVLGIDRNGGWKPPSKYTTALSGIVTVAKMLVLYSAVQARKQEVAELREAGGWSRQDAQDMATSHGERVQQSVKDFMTLPEYGGKPTPMDWVLRLRAYSKGITKVTNSVGHVQWVGNTILYGYVRYSMPQLRSMMHGLVELARMELRRDLLLLEMDSAGNIIPGATLLPAVEWDKIVDNPAELRAGWNFLQDPRNTFGGVDGAGWLSRRVVNERKLYKAFLDVDASRLSLAAGDGVTWARKRVGQYEQAMRLFREHLLVAMHMTGGQPARGTELVTTTYANPPNGESRGIFVEDGLMVYVTLYHKGAGQSGKAKVIHRYLPREVGELLFYYMWMVLPFWHRLERACGRDVKSEPSLFIWEPIPEQAWTGPQRKKKPLPESAASSSDEDGEDSKDGEDNDNNTQTGTGEAPAPPAAASSAGRVERWGTNQVRRAIERASLRWLETKLNTQIWRQNAVAIIHHYVKDPAVLKTLGYGDSEADDNKSNPFDLQSAHTSRTVGQAYGRPADESPWSVQSMRQDFRRVSLAWHQFLQFNSTLSAPKQNSTAAAAQQQQGKEEQYRRWQQMRSTDIQASLERLEGQGAQFRSCQRPVIEAVMQQKSPIVAVMGTGTGKSLTFMLPALTSTGVTVLVVPLLALKSNLRDRCRKAGIECVEWDSEHPHEWAQVVLVVPESVVSAPFESFLNRQRAMGRLDRIVVDEAHIVLESTKGWRTQVLKLRNLVHAETQLVYLTATLKPSEEAEFIRLLALLPKEDGHWFRSPTARPNIAYSVHRFNQAEQDEADVLAALVHEAKEQYPLPSQIIVYCDSVKQTKHYAAMLGAVCFHRETGTAEEKLALLRLLTNGLQQVFVATSALGLGIDRGSIRHVFFVGEIRRLRDLVQQSGRAGRDGAPSKATIIRGAAYTPNGQRRRGGRFRDVEAEVHEIIEGDGCIRVVLDREMDGDTTRQRCMRGEEACSRCEEQGVLGRDERLEEDEVAGAVLETGGNAAHKESAERLQFEHSLAARRSLAQREAALQSQEQLEVQRLAEMLEEWKGCCPWCHVNKWAGEEQHQLAECTQEGASKVRQGVSKITGRLRWDKFSCCFQCGVPQSICASYTERSDAGWEKIPGARCQFAGVLVPSVVAVWRAALMLFDAHVREEMQEAGVWRNKEEADARFSRTVQWLASLIRWGGIQSNNMCRVFVQFVARHAE